MAKYLEGTVKYIPCTSTLHCNVDVAHATKLCCPAGLRAAATTSMPVPNTICIGATLGCALRTFVAFYSTIAFMVVGRGKRRAAAAASKQAAAQAAAAQAAR